MPKKVIQIHQKIFIRANYLNMSGRKIGLFLGCTGGPVERYKKEAKLIVPKSITEKFRLESQQGRTQFKPWQDILLKKMYLKLPVKTLAKELKVSSTSLRIRMRQLNLVVPKELIEKRKLESQFSPGQRPHNKGKKIEEWVTGEALGKIKSTYFKKGHKPHNTRQDEAISIRVDTKTGKAYKYKKVDDNDWQLLSRLVWEEHNGPIPEGDIIIFKNGDTMDTAIENLQCMTRKQALTKNREGFENLPPELKRTIQLKNRLTRKIKHQ